MRNYVGITVHFISHEMQQSAMLRLQTIQRPSHKRKHLNPQFEKNSQQFWNF